MTRRLFEQTILNIAREISGARTDDEVRQALASAEVMAVLDEPMWQQRQAAVLRPGPIVLATVDQVCAAVPTARPEAVAVVMTAIDRMLTYMQGGAFHEALVTFNRALFEDCDTQALLTWFDPRPVNAAMQAMHGGDDMPMRLCLGAFGLLAPVEEPA